MSGSISNSGVDVTFAILQNGGFENVSVSGGQLTIKPGANIEPGTSKVVKIRPQIGSDGNEINVGKAIEIHVDIDWKKDKPKMSNISLDNVTTDAYKTSDIASLKSVAKTKVNSLIDLACQQLIDQGYETAKINTLKANAKAFYSAVISSLSGGHHNGEEDSECYVNTTYVSQDGKTHTVSANVHRDIAKNGKWENNYYNDGATNNATDSSGDTAPSFGIVWLQSNSSKESQHKIKFYGAQVAHELTDVIWHHM